MTLYAVVDEPKPFYIINAFVYIETSPKPSEVATFHWTRSERKWLALGLQKDLLGRQAWPHKHVSCIPKNNGSSNKKPHRDPEIGLWRHDCDHHLVEKNNDAGARGNGSLELYKKYISLIGRQDCEERKYQRRQGLGHRLGLQGGGLSSSCGLNEFCGGKVHRTRWLSNCRRTRAYIQTAAHGALFRRKSGQ